MIWKVGMVVNLLISILCCYFVLIDCSSNKLVAQKTIASIQENELNANRVAFHESSFIREETINYIMNDQLHKPEAKKMKWSKEFLEQAEIEKVYQEYIATGGKVGDVESFANYLTTHAPIHHNWRELTEKSIHENFGYDITRFEHLKDDDYQVYVKIEGTEVPYVVVNARTGYYHG